MFRNLTAASPRDIGKWCACAALLLIPGSSLVLFALFLARRIAGRSATH
jgi:hypothetical protein